MSNSRNRVQSEYEPQLNQEMLQKKLAVASNLVKFLDMSGERSVLEKMINVQPGISCAHRDSYPNEDMNAFLLRNDPEYSMPQTLVREAIIACLENI